MLPAYELPARTRAVCKYLKWATVLLGVIYLVFFFYEDKAAEQIDVLWEGLEAEHRDVIVFSEAKRALLYGLSTFYWFSVFLVIYAVHRVFSGFQSGAPFAMPTVKPVRQLGIMIITVSVIGLTKDTVMHLALTGDSPPGHRLFVVGASTHHAWGLLMGGLFLIIGHIFVQSVRISDENRQIV
ncbi:MAG: DUF2975 domain-containing protein [Hyphomonadaceae bacterium]